MWGVLGMSSGNGSHSGLIPLVQQEWSVRKMFLSVEARDRHVLNVYWMNNWTHETKALPPFHLKASNKSMWHSFYIPVTLDLNCFEEHLWQKMLLSTWPQRRWVNSSGLLPKLPSTADEVSQKHEKLQCSQGNVATISIWQVFGCQIQTWRIMS